MNIKGFPNLHPSWSLPMSSFLPIVSKSMTDISREQSRICSHGTSNSNVWIERKLNYGKKIKKFPLKPDWMLGLNCICKLEFSSSQLSFHQIEAKLSHKDLTDRWYPLTLNFSPTKSYTVIQKLLIPTITGGSKGISWLLKGPS